MLTVLAASRVADTQRAAIEQRLVVDAVTYVGAIEGELERHIGAAYALRDLFDDGPVVSRARYERAIEALGLEGFPAMYGLNVVRPVAVDQLASFVGEKRAGGYPDYDVLAAAGARPHQHWLVSLVAPYETNQHLLGRDVRGAPALIPVFERARDLGQPAISPVVNQPGDGTERVVLAVPAYAVGRPIETAAQRRAHLVGWVVSTVRTAALDPGFASARGIEVVITDDTDGAAVPVLRVGPADGDHRMAVAREVPLHGRSWTVQVAPGPAYAAPIERWAAVVAAALGVLLTAAFAALVHVLGRRSAHARHLVDVRTRQLADTNAELTSVNGELALRLDELRHHARVDEIVQRATQVVSQAGTIEDALEQLRIVLGGVADFDRVGFSIRIDGRRMRVQAVVGPSAPMAPAGIEYIASARLWASFLTRDLVVIRDTTGAAEGTLERELADRGIGGIVTLPLVSRGDVAGILTLGTGGPLALGPGDMRLLGRIADGIAGPIVTLLGLEAERQAAEQLRQLDELKDEFLGVVAHDLRGPLSIVTGYADVLLEDLEAGGLDPQVTRIGLEAMQRAASAQSRLIADLMESQRLALGVAVPARVPLVLSDLVRAAVRDLASGTDGAVAFEDRSGGLLVSADAEWLRRVVTNLVSNAWKYGSPSIDVRVTRSGDAARVEVSDHGAGIAPGDLSRLFQRFSRLGPPGGADAAEGTGLGLYICKQLVEAQEGRIGVESVQGVGATFWFELPASVAAEV